MQNDTLILLDEKIRNTKEYMDKIVLRKILHVRSLVFRKEGGMGGPGGVLTTQKFLLGDKYREFNLSYNFAFNNVFNFDKRFFCNDYLAAIEFARLISKDDVDTVYIVHDIISACGLASMRKRYVLIYHNQGELGYEKENFINDSLNIEEQKILRDIEYYALKNAFRVIFPSKGAKYFFKKTWEYMSNRMGGGGVRYFNLFGW